MYKAEISIQLFTIAGAWRPRELSNYLAIALYKLYTVIAIFLVYSFELSLLMYLILHTLNDIDEFAEALCWFISGLMVCVKMTNIILQRENIIDLIEIFDIKCFHPRDSVEKLMQNKFDFTARKWTKIFLFITISTIMVLTFGGLTKGSGANLPFKASLPFNYNRTTTFWTSYFIQCLSIYSGGLATIGFETLIIVLIIQICSQLDIIYHRLQSLPYLHCKNNNNNNNKNEKSTVFLETEEAEIIKECVLHHNYIYTFGEKLNKIFRIVFGVQFIGSILNTCTLVYSLTTRNELNEKVFAHCLLLENQLFQIFLYCYVGNEVMLQSLKIAEIIDFVDWTMLRKKTKEGLLFIAVRSRRPIIISGGPMIQMTLTTFVTILRTSYAVYNLLQSSK